MERTFPQSFVVVVGKESSRVSPSNPEATKGYLRSDAHCSSSFLDQDKASVLVAVLRVCAKSKDLHRGARVHCHVLRRGLLKNCLDAIVTMYLKCGALWKAKESFDMHQSRDAFTWTALILAYAQTGQAQDALKCYEQMRRNGISPNVVTFTCILNVCGSLGAADKGQEIHNEIGQQGLLQNDVVLGNALVDMYAKCGAVQKARQVLEELPVRDAISWNSLISGYVQQGAGEQALNCFEMMQQDGFSADAVTFTCMLKACGSMKTADNGAKFHDEIAKQGLLKDNKLLGTALVDMYAKCGAFAKARGVLDELHVWDAITWNALISGYIQHGQWEQALECWDTMKHGGLFPDVVTLTCLLKACGNMEAADKGETIHCEIVKQELLGSCLALGTALLDMYIKCGALGKACQVLEELPGRDVTSWNTLIAGYAERCEGAHALNCFKRMQQEGLCPDAATLGSILKACGSLGAADRAAKICDDICRHGLLGDSIVLGNSIVGMYSKCGALAKAQCVLEELPVRNVISWSALIAGYVEQCKGEQALSCYQQMLREGHSPDAVTFIILLKACGIIGSADQGQEIHNDMAKQGLLANDIVLCTSLVHMYVKCGTLPKAQGVLEELHVHNVVSWTSIIAGYAELGEGEQALSCFKEMQDKGVSPNEVTFTCILKACGSIGAADQGETIHEEIAKQGLLGNNILLGTALVDMYAKCGALAKSQRVLEELGIRDVVSWNAEIAGHAHQCKGSQALDCYMRMCCEGFSPDAATFLSVLSACSRSGLIEDARNLFVSMSSEYGINPDLEHYTCMVDLFGRAGHLDRAIQVIKEMSCFSTGVWSALLGSCQKWGDVRVGHWAYECGVEMDKIDAAVYVLMANVHAAACIQDVGDEIEPIRMHGAMGQHYLQAN